MWGGNSRTYLKARHAISKAKNHDYIGCGVPTILGCWFDNCGRNYFSHLSTLKTTFCNPRKIGGLDQDVLPLLLTHMLDLHSSHFKMTMLHNYKVTLCEKNQLNPLMRLWCKISTFVVLNLNLSKYIKLIEITVVQVIGSIEDEQTFNTIAFIKNKLHNYLNTHLDLCTGSHNQQFFTLQNFLYDQAIAKW